MGQRVIPPSFYFPYFTRPDVYGYVHCKLCGEKLHKRNRNIHLKVHHPTQYDELMREIERYRRWRGEK